MFWLNRIFTVVGMVGGLFGGLLMVAELGLGGGSGVAPALGVIGTMVAVLALGYAGAIVGNHMVPEHIEA